MALRNIEELSHDPTKYEAIYGKLQGVVARLETGELPLDEALRLYEQGVKLAAECQLLLDNAELKVQRLQAGPDGEWQLGDDE